MNGKPMALTDYLFAVPDTVLTFPSENWLPEPYSQGDDIVTFVDDVHSWCAEHLSSVPKITYYDAIEFERGQSDWIAFFNSPADLLLFKLKWSDDKRFSDFRESRAHSRNKFSG
jgi:hypothetical protein